MCTENYHWHHDYVRLAWDSGFCFDLHKAKSNFDWSSVGLVDIDRVSRDRDIAVVEKHITTVLHFTLDEDQTKILDPTFVKVFRLSQLSVQYLQFCKRYLDNTVVLLKKQLSKTNEENSHLREHCDELETEIADLKTKLKEVKLSLQYQPPVLTETGGGSIKCSECAKVFLTEEFLLAHMKRRHTANSLQKETDKLQLEIKELKERLNSAEKYVQVEHSSGDTPKDDGRVNLLQNKFEQLKEHVEKELNVLRDQKQYHEKYDRWFELVFQRLENSQRELLERKESAIKEVNIVGDGDKTCTRESWTQTVLEDVKEVETVEQDTTDTQGEAAENAVEQADLNLVKKMQEDIRINTESHLDQIQDILQQKLTGGLEQIQTQMNSFWDKINELQIQQPSPPSPHTEESSPKSENRVPETPIVNKPKPAPRATKLADVKQVKHTEMIVNAPDKQVLQTYYVTTANYPNRTERFISERVESDVNLNRSRAKLKVHKKKSPKVILNKKIPHVVDEDKDRETSPMTSQSEPSDADLLEHREVQAQVKPSNTSTLAQRSIASLKNLLNDQDIQQGLKEELEEMVNLRLKEIGVSPHWLGLPQRSFAQALRIIIHRAQLFAKKNPEYLSIRADILDNVDSQLGFASTKSKPKITVRTKPSRKVRRRSRTKDKKIKSEITITSDQVEGQKEVEVKKSESKVIKQLTPTKKKVLFDLETSSSVSDKSKRGTKDVQDKENVLSLTKQNVELLVTQPRTIFKNLDTDTSAASSVLDGSKRQTVAQTTVKSANDEVSDWEMSDILT